MIEIKENTIFRFTEKGRNLFSQSEEIFDEWLSESGLTREDFLKYKDIKGFHISEDDIGIHMAYYENGQEKFIGAGFYQEQKIMACWFFAYGCCLLDLDTSGCEFTKTLLEWAGNENG